MKDRDYAGKGLTDDPVNGSLNHDDHKHGQEGQDGFDRQRGGSSFQQHLVSESNMNDSKGLGDNEGGRRQNSRGSSRGNRKSHDSADS
jgi:hypothetical protein